MNPVSIHRVDDNFYQLIFTNGVVLGDALKDADGYFYFWPINRRGLWAAYVLRGIADTLDEMNEPWNKIVEQSKTL